MTNFYFFWGEGWFYIKKNRVMNFYFWKKAFIRLFVLISLREDRVKCFILALLPSRNSESCGICDGDRELPRMMCKHVLQHVLSLLSNEQHVLHLSYVTVTSSCGLDCHLGS